MDFPKEIGGLGYCPVALMEVLEKRGIRKEKVIRAAKDIMNEISRVHLECWSKRGEDCRRLRPQVDVRDRRLDQGS